MPMTIHSIAHWFKEAVPQPTEKNKSVQIGVHFEEVGEMLAAIGEKNAAENMDCIGTAFKTQRTVLNEPDRLELLDSLCDQIVTAIGVAHMYGLNIVGGLAEVNRSNYSKFVDGKPVFDANGKIAKPPSFSKPDLTPFVGDAQ